MALTTARVTAMLRDMTQRFDKSAKSAKPFYPRVTMRANSGGYDEKYGILGDVPQMREWLGDRVAKEVRSGTYELVNKKWEGTERIEKDTLNDDRIGLLGNRMEQLGKRAATHPDKLFFQTLVAGASSVCFDNQYFFDTDHSWGDSGTQDNALTYDASDHTAVTAAEALAASEAAIAAMLGFKDDQGEPLNQPTVERLSDIMIVFPLALRKQFYKAYEATLVGSGESNVIIDRPTLVCSTYLTDAAVFYTLNLGEPIKPFIFQAREPLSRGMKGMDDMERKDVLFMTQARYAMGYGAWWNGVQTTFN